jgi:hypothetical protein
VRAHRVVEALGFMRTAEFVATGSGRVSGSTFVLYTALVGELRLRVGGRSTVDG